MENVRCQHVIILDRDSGIYLLVLSYNYFVKLQIFHPLKYYIILLLHFAGKTICYFEIREEKKRERNASFWRIGIATPINLSSQQQTTFFLKLHYSWVFYFVVFLQFASFFIPTLNTVIQCQTTKLYFCTKLSSHS